MIRQQGWSALRGLTVALAVGAVLVSCSSGGGSAAAGAASAADALTATAGMTSGPATGAASSARPKATAGVPRSTKGRPAPAGAITRPATPTSARPAAPATPTRSVVKAPPAAPAAPTARSATHPPVTTARPTPAAPLYPVAGVVDGDTLKVRIDGTSQRVRIIGIDTPELHKPGYQEQCFGQRAASRMQSLVQSKQVRLQADPTQDDKDRYGRLLRHVLLPDGRSVALIMISEGYGREYTYDRAYAGQADYRAAQTAAEASGAGLWGACGGFPPAVPLAPKTTAAPAPPTTKAPLVAAPPNRVSTPPTVAEQPPAEQDSGCDIKGNINSKGEKIYHTRGSRSYAATKITESKGERWFCTPAEAEAAGWRAARD